MLYRELGKTRLMVSRLCFGTLTMGPLQANLSPERGGELLAYAFARGINFIDTAQFYRSYLHLRQGLKKTNRDIIIASKTYSYTREQALEAVDEARRLVDRDVIDIFLLHEQESEYTFSGHKPALDALYDLKSKGVIRAVGASTHHIAAVKSAVKLGLDVIHPLINIEGLGIVDGGREEMEIALNDAHKANIGIYTMKALGGGNLFTRAEECFNYALSLPFADSIAIGMQSEDEIDANINYFKHKEFKTTDIERLNRKKRRILIEEWCTGCGSCCEVCSQKALQLKDNRAVCDPSLCILCGYCGGHCPMWAIKII